MTMPAARREFLAETMKAGDVFAGPFLPPLVFHIVVSVEHLETNRVRVFWLDSEGKIEHYTYASSSVICVSSIF